MSKIRIVSDGTPAGTSVFNGSGELMTNVTGVMLSADVGENTVRAWIEFDVVELDVIADAP